MRIHIMEQMTDHKGQNILCIIAVEFASRPDRIFGIFHDPYWERM